MTETVSNSRGTRPEAGTGLRLERIYTKPGRHPYDEVIWTRQDVVLTNWRDGSVNFEQRGVEFPDFWSPNAVQIVTSKYFRGAVGTPAREWSLKQLIDRVVLTYTQAGRDNGYFATDEDAEIFEHEMTYTLLRQIFSFNSPVWFNVGTAAPQQVSACQPYGALVSTPAGMIPIGRLVENNAVGTKVYDAHGLTSVVATKTNGVKDVFRIHTKAGHTLDVTGDHLVWKSTGPGTGRWVQARELRAHDQLEWHRRAAFGDAEIDPVSIAEAALAGWLQSDGFVGQYPNSGNPSLIVEAMSVNDDELAWVLDAIRVAVPEAVLHKPICVKTQDQSLDCRRTRMSGKYLIPYVERWGLRARGVDMVVPERLFTAPLPVVAAYLRSLFQAEGYVSQRERSCLVGLGMISEELIRGVQGLLARFGIFARVTRYVEKRADRHDLWCIGIQSAGDRRIFADEIGFIGSEKAQKLEASFAVPGHPARDVKRLEIARIEQLGAMKVYDIQTESGEYLSNSLRVHNCFLLAVDDSMNSILNWYKEEGLIFKGGSGSGVNLSRIRSSKELLSSGGNASGPVSFMRGADASAGTIKSGGATRRAAKMVILDVDHPDIEEFIETKVREEAKIRVLRDAGYDMDLGGHDIYSVQYQNANNSVRVSDEFMRAVEAGAEFGLHARTTGEVIETIDAAGLFRRICEAAWACADPGIQYDDTINDWHTCPESGRITTSNPCAEYVHLDNSSCNLASLNLMKFLRESPDGTQCFDAVTFAKCAELVITAMDISICFADFPTEAIGETTRAYRQLGMGYANLGALLMATGHAYDSDGGRALAGSVTSLMTAVAYKRSAELAAVVGTYDGYARNAEGHTRVMRKHAAANAAAQHVDELDTPVWEAAAQAWQDCLAIGERNGWRNAQATLLAPTGTSGLAMDVDTTGIEPALGLITFKKLVGGGSMQFVNGTVPAALHKLGYQPEQIEAIIEHIAEHGNVIDAPGLRAEHYVVFDCAMGERAIAPMGHVRMLAAVQPFLSGAVSKTINMPETATVEDVEDIYTQGWKLGLKAVAIYRDNCKVGQPLSVSKREKTTEEAPAPIEYRPVRRRLPKSRTGITTSFTVGGAEGYITANSYPDDGLGEVFLKISKQGSTLAGLMDAFSVAISVGLQYGVPLETYVSKFTNMRFEPAGLTDDPDVRMAQSIMDYIFRRLALDFLPSETRSALGIYSAAQRARQVETGSYEIPAEDEAALETTRSAQQTTHRPQSTAVAAQPLPGAVHSPMELIEAKQGFHADAPLCFTCGVKMQPAGSCYLCSSCGSTSGCS